jgi:signal transduction histidine kinase
LNDRHPRRFADTLPGVLGVKPRISRGGTLIAGSATRVKWLSLALLVLLLGGLLGLARYLEFTVTQTAEAARLQGQANILAEHLQLELQSASRALGSMRETIAAAGPNLPAATSRRLQSLVEILPGVGDALILDKRGRVWAADREGTIGQDQSGRDNFKAALAAPDATVLYISAPVAPSEVDLYSLVVSRACLDADGGFDGVTVIGLSRADLEAAVRSVLYADGMRVAFVLGDGRLLLNEPSVPEKLSTDLTHPDGLFTRHMQSGQSTSVVSGKVRFLDEQMMVANQTLQPAALRMDRPVIIAVGRDLSNIYAKWQQQTELYVVAFVLLALAAAVALHFQVLRRKQLELGAQQRHRELTHLSRVAMLGELSGAFAHELNQPLTAILSNAQAAQRFLAQGKASHEELGEILRDIVSEDQRAGEIIRRLRVMVSPAERPLQSVDLNEVVSESLALLHGELESQRVTLRAELAASPPRVTADSVQLQQVLINLLLNACDAMREIPAAVRGLMVRTGQAADGSVCVSVIDQGSGIAADVLEKIFDSYFTTKPSGMGLGLSVCRSIVRAHGGRIWAENNQGRGASFHFSLPAALGEGT